MAQAAGLEERANNAEQAFEEQDEELQQLEALRQEHQQSLAKNRDLIQLLKSELEKSVEKCKNLDSAN